MLSPLAGEGLHHRDYGGDLFPSRLLVLSFPPFAACWMRARPAQWVESHAAGTMHGLIALCTGAAHGGMVTVHVRRVYIPKAPFGPPWSWALTSLMVCSGYDHLPSGIPAAATEFRQEEPEGGCSGDPWETALHTVLRSTHSRRTAWLFSSASENISHVPVTCLLCRSSSAGKKKQFQK